MGSKSRIESAQNAYNKKNVEFSRHAHSKEAIKRHFESHTKEKGKYLRDYVYGALDGIVTTFAVVSGVEGAQLSSSIILVLGFANLLADGISMGVGNYLGTKSELEYIRKERAREYWEIEHVPEGEREEIRQIFKRKGFKGKDLERAVKIVTSDKDIWVKTMMLEELGLVDEDKTPVQSGLATFVAFALAGFVPLIAFILTMFLGIQINNAFLVSIIMTGVTLFVVGSLRSFITHINWIKSGMEMLIVGGLTAAVAYVVGFLLRSIV